MIYGLLLMAALAAPQEIRPQLGPQELFLASPAQVAVYGGAAGGGKTYAALLEPLRHIGDPDFNAVILRRYGTHITQAGGLWDTARGLYGPLGAVPNQMLYRWTFPSGATISFAHMNNDAACDGFQGSQICYLGFDEATHFTEKQFWFMLSRNRTMCEVQPYVRLTCNPDPNSFVADLIAWWIDPKTGYAIPERAGIIRYFARNPYDDELVWGDSREEVASQIDGCDAKTEVKSFTFIPASVYDNQILLDRDPSYLASLKSQHKILREQLLYGNWLIKPAAGLYFPRLGPEMIVDSVPQNVVRRIRWWDRAASVVTEANSDPDWTAGVRVSLGIDGVYYIEHVERFRASGYDVEQRILALAKSDGITTEVGLDQDPGQAGKDQAEHMRKQLAGHTTKIKPVTGSKEVRAGPAASHWQAGNVRLVAGDWLPAFATEAENFPPESGGHDDQIDAFSGALNELAKPGFVYPRIS